MSLLANNILLWEILDNIGSIYMENEYGKLVIVTNSKHNNYKINVSDLFGTQTVMSAEAMSEYLLKNNYELIGYL